MRAKHGGGNRDLTEPLPVREVEGGSSHPGTCFSERLNLLGTRYTDSVPGPSHVRDKSVFCNLVVDGEGGKGQRTITDG